MLILLTILYIILFCFLIATLKTDSIKKYHFLAKTLTSLGFIVIAIYCGYISGNYNFFFSMLWGLIFCLIGDMALAINIGNSKYFLAGIVFFLIAHIIFVIGLSKYAAFTPYELIIPIIFVLVAYFLTNMPHMNTGELRPYIIIYAFFVSLLLSKTLILFMSNPASTHNIVLLIGSICFLLSDLILLFVCFYENAWKYLGLFNLISYYTGMYLLAYSIMC